VIGFSVPLPGIYIFSFPPLLVWGGEAVSELFTCFSKPFFVVRCGQPVCCPRELLVLEVAVFVC